MILIYLDLKILGKTPFYVIKRKLPCKKIPNYAQITKDHWSDFANSTDSHLLNACLRPAVLPSNEQDPIKHANKLWALLKESIRKAARDLSSKTVTPAQAHSIDIDPPSLLAKRADHRYISRLIADMRKLQFYTSDTMRKLWTNTRRQLLNLMSTYNIQGVIPPSRCSTANRQIIRKILRKLKNAILTSIKHEELTLKDANIKKFAEQRCENFSTNKASFITSTLDRSKRTIILDRILVDRPDPDTSSTTITSLLTDPKEIKTAVNEHFRFVTPRPSSAT